MLRIPDMLDDFESWQQADENAEEEFMRSLGMTEDTSCGDCLHCKAVEECGERKFACFVHERFIDPCVHPLDYDCVSGFEFE